ncbi:hypothetical protein H4218_004630 [Coemansia sp. IMI 209128]|nr:hypothetical protein H4218_004630 [Coemansia sp. IMI 209128]
MTSMDGMTFAPLVALSRLFRLRAQHKPSSRAADQYFAQEKIPVPVDMGVLGSIAPEAVLPESASMSHSERLDPIVAIRRSVDEVAMYWLNLLSIPVVVAAVIFYTLLHFKFDLPLLEFAKEQSINVPRVIKFVAWLPQIIVNYKAKSGSLVPMVIVLYSLASAVAATIVYHLSGHRMPGVITAYSFPVYLSYIVLILQWIIYRKAKQD